jgi:hypothetical protein
MNAKADFAAQLVALGFAPTPIGPNGLAIAYTVAAGRFAGRQIRLSIDINGDFPRNPPGGPHVSPHLLPLNPNAPGHPERVAPSGFGSDWQYWSRPCAYWGKEGQDRSVEAYLAHVRSLFASIP